MSADLPTLTRAINGLILPAIEAAVSDDRHVLLKLIAGRSVSESKLREWQRANPELGPTRSDWQLIVGDQLHSKIMALVAEVPGASINYVDGEGAMLNVGWHEWSLSS